MDKERNLHLNLHEINEARSVLSTVGLTTPFQLTQTRNKPKYWNQKMRIDHQLNEFFKQGNKEYPFSSDNTIPFVPKNIPSTPVPVELTMKKIYQLQADTLQPEIAAFWMDIILKTSSGFGQDFALGFGGDVRVTSTPEENYNGEEVYPLFFRTFMKNLTSIPVEGSDIPEEELISQEMLPGLMHPHNLDIYTLIPASHYDILIANIALQTAWYLHRKNIPFRLEKIPDGYQIITTDWEKFWHPYEIKGQIYKGTPLKGKWHKEYFELSPELPITGYAFQLRKFHPGNNPDWSLIQLAHGITHNDTFVDMRELYVNTIPSEEEGNLLMDQRFGFVGKRQRIPNVYKQGKVWIPNQEYYLTEEGIPEDTYEIAGNAFPRGIAQTARELRYATMLATYRRLPHEYGENKHFFQNFITSLKRLWRQMEESTNKRFKIGAYIEYLTNLIVATHHHKIIASFLRDIARDANPKKQILPNIGTLNVVRDTYYPTTDYSAGHIVSIYADRTKPELQWTSGIDDLLGWTISELEKAQRELMSLHDGRPPRKPVVQIPRGSKLAQLCWLYKLNVKIED